MNETGTRRSLIYNLYENRIKPEEIEQRSFDTIDNEADRGDFSDDEWIVVRRMMHTTADLTLGDSVKFSPDAIESAVEALRNGGHIYTDANMSKSGISLARLKSANPDYTKDKVLCHIADGDVAEEGKREGLPRSLYAIRKAQPSLDGAIVLIGNAPVALLELNRMIAEGETKPALVVGAPVGFVHVLESKAELMSMKIPYIVVDGRRGGSGIAVSVIHSLCAITATANKNAGE